VKIGDLVRISPHGQTCAGQIGVIVHVVQFGGQRIPLPRVFVGGKIMLFGRDACEVISESR
jgi:hypothetical protein